MNLSLLFLPACAPNEQIWLLQVTEGTGESCETTVTHNFTSAYEPAGGVGPWLEDTLSDQSDGLSFAQISFLDRDTAKLVIGAEVWPGTSDGDGGWTFSWTGWRDDRSSREHDDGYRYTEQEMAERVETLRLTLDAGAGSGSWSVTQSTTFAYTESDQWDESAGLLEGDIPADAWLVVDQGPLGATPVVNQYDTSECNEVTCALTLATVCEEAQDIAATFTGYTSEEAFEHLKDPGNRRASEDDRAERVQGGSAQMPNIRMTSVLLLTMRSRAPSPSRSASPTSDLPSSARSVSPQ
jgi:hypothetical protein